MDDLIAYAPEAERVREALRPVVIDITQRAIELWQSMERFNHRHIMRRKVRKAYRI